MWFLINCALGGIAAGLALISHGGASSTRQLAHLWWIKMGRMRQSGRHFGHLLTGNKQERMITECSPGWRGAGKLVEDVFLLVLCVFADR